MLVLVPCVILACWYHRRWAGLNIPRDEVHGSHERQQSGGRAVAGGPPARATRCTARCVTQFIPIRCAR